MLKFNKLYIPVSDLGRVGEFRKELVVELKRDNVYAESSPLEYNDAENVGKQETRNGE